MPFEVEPYTKKEIHSATKIWNEVVRSGISFPQEEELDEISGDEFFKIRSRNSSPTEQSQTGRGERHAANKSVTETGAVASNFKVCGT